MISHFFLNYRLFKHQYGNEVIINKVFNVKLSLISDIEILKYQNNQNNIYINIFLKRKMIF